jgi:hypothetical protein
MPHPHNNDAMYMVGHDDKCSQDAFRKTDNVEKIRGLYWTHQILVAF